MLLDGSELTHQLCKIFARLREETELSDKDYIGTSLTIQTSVGFGIALLSIQLMPFFVIFVSWTFGFTILALGPLIGVLSLNMLRKEPDSSKIGQGKK